MKISKNVWLVLPLTCIVFFTVQACGSSEPVYDPPSQAEMDAVNSSMDDFLLQEAKFIDDYLLSSNEIDCITLEDAIQSLNGVVACSESGDFTAHVTDFYCDDLGPLQANFVTHYDFSNCRDSAHGIQDGSVEVSWDWSTQWLNYTLDSSVMYIDSLPVEYAATHFGFEDGTQTCGGTTYYDDYACDWEADCTCILEDAFKSTSPIKLEKQSPKLFKRIEISK